MHAGGSCRVQDGWHHACVVQHLYLINQQLPMLLPFLLNCVSHALPLMDVAGIRLRPLDVYST